MAKKKYTVLVFSQQASRVKRFIFSPLTLKIGAAVLTLLLVVSAYLFYDYITYQKNIFDLKELRNELNSRQAEIQSFLEKISLLEEQLTRLKLVEEQVKKDLKEVQELKNEKKVKKLTPLPSVPQKTSENKQDLPPHQKALLLRQDEVSILERERPKLVSRLYMELMDLSKEAFQRERTLKDLKEFLQAQKSVLLSIPSLWPVYGRITSSFGEVRFSPSSGGTRPHMGIDISAPTGTPIVAPADGVVLSAGREAEYGLLICVDHGHGFTTMYGHLKEIRVKPGDRVKTGQLLGTVGTTGNTTGPHLHYEVRIHGRPANPFSYLTQTS
ncbi:MAG TPA: peptidoglycan DD-metalloendopeptidase family protein [Thermodesulfobacteriota bacterium]|nr:peptidoglycan DD-metalloendopeptidase family protein [Thermodesulfobacteriota bacterium]